MAERSRSPERTLSDLNHNPHFRQLFNFTKTKPHTYRWLSAAEALSLSKCNKPQNMEKTPFQIHKIEVKETPDGYTAIFHTKTGDQLQYEFYNEHIYTEVQEYKNDLSKQLDILYYQIEATFKDNPQYHRHYSNCETCIYHLSDILQDGGDEAYEDAMGLLRTCADEKDIEFDGYFNQRWVDSANTIINFEEEYFDDLQKIELYVYLSAAVDREIYFFLEYVQERLFKVELTPELVKEKIEYLTKVKGVRF